VLSGEATNTNFIVFGLTPLVLEPTIYHTRGEHTLTITPPMHGLLYNAMSCKIPIYIYFY
jgi:hypothetical protein